MGISETIIAAIIGALATMADGDRSAAAQPCAQRRPAEAEEKPHALGARHHGADDRLHRRRLRLVVAARGQRQGRTRGDHGSRIHEAVRGARGPPESGGRRGPRMPPTNLAPPSPRATATPARPNRWRICRPADSHAARRSGSGDLHRARGAAHGAVRLDSFGGAHHQRARAGARAEERISVAGTRCGAPTLGSLHIAAAPAEYPGERRQRSVCLDVANWSVEDTLAVRMIVEYAFGGPPRANSRAARAHALRRLRATTENGAEGRRT